MPAPLGNQNAAKAKRWQKALERALARAGAGDVDSGLNPIADSVVAAAMAGDKDAWKELGDRLDGKAIQQVDGNLILSHTFAVPLPSDTRSPDEWAQSTDR